MKKQIHLWLTLFLFSSAPALAQLVTFNGSGGLPIPPGAPAQTVGITQSPCSVSGVGIIGGCVTIDNVTIDLQHTWVGDIGILLIGPGGQVLELSTGNGGSGNDYTGTVFTDNAGAFITTGTPPFSGVFRPEGRVTNLGNPYSNAPALGTFTFANTYNGTNADGVWTLYVNDFVALDIGVINSWSITFNIGGTPPVADAGPDVSQCTGQTTTLTATGGGNYQWSTGGTAASINVNPSVTTTYTVTVTTPGCGSDTDEVVVTVSPRPAVTITAANTNVCGGDCQTIQLNFTGTAPFTVTLSSSATGPITQTFGNNSGTVQICPPTGTPPGPLLVQTQSVSDAFCICN
jgi:subtilisin-like proprotein convertase family protein